MIDRRVLVKNFNSEDRSCYVGNFRGNVFRIRENNIFIRENFIIIGYYELYYIHIQFVKGYLQFPAPGTPAGEGYRIILVWF